jgi:peptidoglycan/LPS O-acetylase OafA/YrhL
MVDAPPAAPRRIAYEPALDGIRGLAVVAVLLYHHFSWLRGGFLGVDVFFVLSGYLITSLLVAEHAGSGRISLVDFWKRRARRLLPALLVLLVGAVALSHLVYPARMGGAIGRDGLATLFYVENWYRIAANPPRQPFGHAWSLAIEEQWYLVWPLVALALLVWVRSRAVLVAITGVLAAGSAALMWLTYAADGSHSRAYMSTHTRAHELLVGAGLAFLLGNGVHRVGRRASAAFELAGGAALLVIVWLASSARSDDPSLYRGGFLGIALVVAILLAALRLSSIGVLRRILAWRPLVAVGLLSYGLYLFHLPVYGWLTHVRLEIGDRALLVVRLLVTGSIATVSFFALERPVRAGVLRGRRPALLTAGAVALVAVVLVAGTPRVTLEPTDARLTYLFASQLQQAPRDATRLLVVGDDLAYQLTMTRGLYSAPGLRAVTMGAPTCALTRAERTVDGELVSPSHACHRWPAHFRMARREFEPHRAVLLLGGSDAVDLVVDGTPVPVGSPTFEARVSRALEIAKRELEGGRTRLLVALPPPCAPKLDPRNVEHLRASVSEWAHRRQVEVADLGDIACDGSSLRNDVIGDDGSLRPAGADAIWRWLDNLTPRR